MTSRHRLVDDAFRIYAKFSQLGTPKQAVHLVHLVGATKLGRFCVSHSIDHSAHVIVIVVCVGAVVASAQLHWLILVGKGDALHAQKRCAHLDFE